MRVGNAFVEHAAATALACCLVFNPGFPLVALAEPPSAEAQADLKKGFTNAAQGFLEPADTLLTKSIAEWKRTDQPADELAALYKTRATIRQRQSKPVEALADFDEAIRQIKMQSSKPDPAEVQRTYALRAKTNAELGRWVESNADSTEAINRLDDLDAVEATNPFLYLERATVRSRLSNWAAAADDAKQAELDFKAIGDKVRRLNAAADGALALYGTEGGVADAVDAMRFVFKNKGVPASNNPDDIPLLQELSRKDAELHLAYAGHLYSSVKDAAAAETQWESGCIRLEAYVRDGADRKAEEEALALADARRADESGRVEKARASTVSSPTALNSDFAARLNGLDPQSPYVTQRPNTGYFWYKTSEGAIERRDPGNALANVDLTLSCGKFRSSEWVAQNRPEWPPSLRSAVADYAAAVPQRAIVMPPKGSAPSRGEVSFGGDDLTPRCDASKSVCDDSYVSVWKPLTSALKSTK